MKLNHNCKIKSFIFLSTLTFSFFTSISQLRAQQTFTIKGKVVDSLSQKSIPNSTVILMPVNRKTVSDTNGDFSFNGLVPDKTYSIAFSSVGYSTKTITIRDVPDKNNMVILKPVVLSLVISNLKEVVIKSGIITQESDRIVYNIQADPRSKAFNMFDMVTRIPLLSINSNDDILLKGQKNYLVLIDGKPSGMASSNTSEYLKNLKAANVAQVEVITSVPARYQDQGLDGIINIKMFNPPVASYNGSLGARFLTPDTKSLNGILVTKRKKLTASIFINPSWQNSPVTDVNNTRYTLSDKSTLQQRGSNSFKSQPFKGTYEMGYDIDPLNFINASVTFNRDNRSYRNFQTTSGFDSLKALTQNYNFTNTQKQIRTAVDASVNYQKSYKKNPNRLLTASFKYSSVLKDENVSNDIDSILNYPPSHTQQDNQTSSKEATLQLDYVHPIKKLTIESGIKDILRNNYTQTQYFTFNGGTTAPMLDSSQTDYLKHMQNVIVAYNSYMFKLATWSVRAGGRLEITDGHADFITNGTSINENEVHFLPNFLLQKQLGGSISLNASYEQRAERPGIWLLNPFVNRSNPQYITSGNPALQSVLYHTLDLQLSMVKKGYVNLESKYTIANNAIEPISVLGVNNVVFTSYYNVGQTRDLKTSLTFSYPFSKKIDWSIYSWLDRIQNRAYLNDQFIDRTGVSVGAMLNTTYTINNDLRLNLYGIASSPLIDYQQKSNFFYDSSIGVTKYLFKRKYTITVMALNPFTHYRTSESTTTANDFTQVNSSRSLYRQFSFSFSYRFGKANNTVKKNKRSIENNDVKSGENN